MIQCAVKKRTIAIYWSGAFRKGSRTVSADPAPTQTEMTAGTPASHALLGLGDAGSAPPAPRPVAVEPGEPLHRLDRRAALAARRGRGARCGGEAPRPAHRQGLHLGARARDGEIGRASCRERVEAGVRGW